VEDQREVPSKEGEGGALVMDRAGEQKGAPVVRGEEATRVAEPGAEQREEEALFLSLQHAACSSMRIGL